MSGATALAGLTRLAGLVEFAGRAELAGLAGLAAMSAIKVSAIVAIALIAVRLARHRSAALRHWLLAIGLACASAMPLLQMVLPAWDMRTMWTSSSWMRTEPSLLERARMAEWWRRHALERGTTASAAALAAASAASASAGAADATSSAVDSAAGDAAVIAAIVLIVWTIGAMVCISRVLIGLARLAWLAAHARRVVDGRWIELSRALAHELGVRRSIRLLHSPHPSLLATWGLLRPTIILPAAAIDWSDDRLRVVFCHELAHVRRGDWTVQIGAELLRGLYWFNPLLSIASSQLRHDSEIACDDEVLEHGIDRTAYATHLLDLARAGGRHRGLDAVATAMARPLGLERRIRVMLNADLDRTPLTRVARLACVIALGIVTLPVAGVRAAQQPAQASASLAGTVVDPSGAIVTSGEVTLVDPNGEPHAVALDENGRFAYTDLHVGEYAIDVRAAGFAPMTDAVTLASNQRLERRFALAIGTVRETIVSTDPDAPEPVARARTLPHAFPDPRPSGKREGTPSTAVIAPNRVRLQNPVYPARLRGSGIAGTVMFEARIATDGSIQGVQVMPLAPSPELVAAALVAVREWRYIPTRLHGVPIDTPIILTFEFVP